MSETTDHEPQDGARTLVRSEERLDVSTETVVSRRIRLRKRVVTEERTVTVVVRREELVVDDIAAVEDPSVDTAQGDERGGRTPTQPDGSTTQSDVPALVWVLHEEQVEVTTRTVPVEHVRVYVDRVHEQVSVEETLQHENVEIDRSGVASDDRTQQAIKQSPSAGRGR